MMHPDRDQIQRLLDGELADDGTHIVRAHIERCEVCQVTAAALQHEQSRINGLLSTLDDPIPARAARFRHDQSRMSTGSWLRRAAGVAILLGVAGAAWALPGSPLRVWLERAQETGPSVATDDEPQPTVHGGLDLPVDAPVMIALAGTQRSGSLFITIADTAEAVTVTVRGGSARLASESKHDLRIDNTGSTADHVITVPRTAGQVVIRVGDTIVFRKDGDRITTVAHANPAGTYVLPLTR